MNLVHQRQYLIQDNNDVVCACSESDSGSSEDSVDLKKSNRTAPDIKVEYSKTNAVDDWQTDLLVPPQYNSLHQPPSDYSELRYPRKVYNLLVMLHCKGKKMYCKPLMYKSMTQLRSVTCHMGSHSVTCYPTQVNTPCLSPSHKGRYGGTRFTYHRGMEGWVDLGDLLHTYRRFTRPQTVTHPSTNRAQCRLTTLIRPTPLTTTLRRWFELYCVQYTDNTHRCIDAISISDE